MYPRHCIACWLSEESMRLWPPLISSDVVVGRVRVRGNQSISRFRVKGDHFSTFSAERPQRETLLDRNHHLRQQKHHPPTTPPPAREGSRTA